ncbi:amidase [Roseomonas sp. E05]|uniref:amidase n=1 Tax=Roseomonas sp. E05 TaxID=3046310 RepID=UPI0024BA1C1B|nr:amidase [Roseomonas sp. E05]MDJ0389211.1 amidase [Roseomonas sp. E05]
MSRPLHLLGAAELHRAYAARAVSPVEVVEALLARIAAQEGRVHAFIRLDVKGARAAAAEAAREIAAAGPRSPLHGVPVGLKDIIDVAGQPTTCHSKLRLDHVAARDATVVARLRGAGAILLGKLSTHEFAVGGPCFDLPFPPARNPWNLAHHPGGSSSGSGAGLAAGFFPLALGSDTGGSVRNPASAAGLVGLKPTYGLLPRTGVFPLSWTLDHVGPMARSVEDVALLTRALAGHDPADPGSAAAPGWTDPAADLARGVAGLRIGFVRHFHEADLPADPEVASALEAAAAEFVRQGATLRDVTLPPHERFAAVNRVILTAEAFAIHGDWLRRRPGDYAGLTRAALLTGAFLSAEDLMQAMRLRRLLTAAVDDAFREVDVLLCASSVVTPARIEDAAEVARTYPLHARAPFNVTGHPAVGMMAGLSSAGLPLSLQLVARPFEERTLLRAAAAWERAAGLPRHPPLALEALG